MPHPQTDRLPPTLPVPESTPLPAEPRAGEAHGMALIAMVEFRLDPESRTAGRSAAPSGASD